VSEVVAFGVSDVELGQVVHIAVTSLIDSDSLESDLQQFVTKIMPNYMIPRHIHVLLNKMPSTASGKIDRPLVIKQCLSYFDSISLTGDDS
jgi:acyl-CoA synthetase (AMP-forming)/AMP-acid ligase II